MVVTFDPNPVSYGEEGWFFEVILTETNGVKVTLNSLKITEYDKDGGKIGETTNWGIDKIITKFGSNILEAFGTLKGSFGYLWEEGEGELAKYVEIALEGIDEKGNSVEASEQVEIIPLPEI